MIKNTVLAALFAVMLLPSALVAQRRMDTLWVARYAGLTGSDDVAYGVHIDGSDNCYVYGRSTGADTSNDIILLKYAPDSTLLWERRYEGPGPGHDVPAWSGLAADGAGNIYITGYSMGAGSGYDIVVIKYDTAGTEQWVRRYNGAANLNDVPNGIAVDSSGNVAVTGFTTVTDGTRDVVVIKYSPAGGTRWIRTHNGPTGGNDAGKAICADAGGNFIVVGYERAVTTGFLTAKYDSTGTQLWTEFFDWRPHASWPDSALVVTVDESGNIYVSGASMWHTGFLPSYSWCTLKYGPNGTRVWVDSGYQYPRQYPRYPFSIHYDRPRGRIIVTGIEVQAPSSTGPDMAFYAFDTGGTVLWRRTVSSASQGASDYAYRVAVNPGGAVFGCGFFSRGNPNGMVYGTVKLSPAGALLWTADHGYDPPSQATVAEDLAFDSQGNLYVTGYYQWNSGDSSRNIGTIKYAFHDAAVVSIVMPQRMDTGDVVIPRAVVANWGSYRESIPVRMSIGAGYSQTAYVPLAPFETDTATFPLFRPTTYGVYVVRCSTRLGPEYDQTNDRKVDTLFVQRAGLDVAATAIEAPSGRVDSGAVVTPACSVMNYSQDTTSYGVRMSIDGSYTQIVGVANHPPGVMLRVTFPPWVADVVGLHVVRCSTECPGDTYPANDALGGSFTVSSAPPWPDTWSLAEPLPSGGGKAIKDGGWLVVGPGPTDAADYVFAAKGNKTGEFYRYSVATGSWTAAAPIPAGREAKLPGKGCKAVADNLGSVYMVKGNNTQGFWHYNAVTDSWKQMPDVPLGSTNKRVKAGTDLAFVQKSDGPYVYFLKGQKDEFWRFSIQRDSWEPLQGVPVNLPAIKTNAGSWIELVETGTDAGPYLYLHKSKFHHMHRYDLSTESWEPVLLPGMPFMGRSGKTKKSKDGGSAAFWDGHIYSLKGGNTCEFWRYAPATDSWVELASVPEIGLSGKKKKVKAGGDIVSVGGGALFVIKGSSTNDCWRAVITEALADRSGRSGVQSGVMRDAPSTMRISPNPLSAGRATLTLKGPAAQWSSGLVRVSITDVSGRILQSAICNLKSEPALDLSSLRAGVYLVKVETGGYTATRKLVVQLSP